MVGTASQLWSPVRLWSGGFVSGHIDWSSSSTTGSLCCTVTLRVRHSQANTDNSQENLLQVVNLHLLTNFNILLIKVQHTKYKIICIE